MENIKFIEDVEKLNAPIEAEAILTDDALTRGGLVKVEAFIRTKTSAAAARKAKQREAQKAAGMKQINVTVPVEAHEKIKAIAKACAEGKSFENAIQSVTSHAIVTDSGKGWKYFAIKILTALLAWLQKTEKTT